MTIGVLRDRLVIQQETDVPDGGGGFSRTWSNVATVWGNVRPLRGSESIRAQQLEQRISHRITIRHRTGVDASMRIAKGARYFNIRSVIDPDERQRFLLLSVDENAT